MLLLILFSGCLASCAAQTTNVPSSTVEISTMTTTPLPHLIQTTAVSQMPDSVNNTLAILQTAVQSSLELDERTAALILHELYNIIQRSGTNLRFTLNLKNITKV